MEGSIKELSDYRIARAREEYETAELLFREGKYRSSINRSYHSIFHALRAVTALDRFDSSKHSGIIAYINKNYVKSGIFDKSLSKMLDSSFRMRERADYQDFYIASKEDAENQMSNANTVIGMIENYLNQISEE